MRAGKCPSCPVRSKRRQAPSSFPVADVRVNPKSPLNRACLFISGLTFAFIESAKQALRSTPVKAFSILKCTVT